MRSKYINIQHQPPNR